MEVIVGTASRRPIASEIKALEYNAEMGLARGSCSRVFCREHRPKIGVAVRLLAPALRQGCVGLISTAVV
jgi:hypothetical protein